MSEYNYQKSLLSFFMSDFVTLRLKNLLSCGLVDL